MREGWRTVELGSLCAFFGGGAFPRIHQGRRAGTYPFVKVSDLSLPGNERFLLYANNWVGEETLSLLKTKLVPSRATVFAKIGEGLKSEKLRLTSRLTAIDNNLMAAIPKAENVDNQYLFYLLSTVGLSDWAQGSALPFLRQGDLAQIPVTIPPIAVQRRIAGVLGALDDLIETNKRLIDTHLLAADAIALAEEPSGSQLNFAEVCAVFGGGTPSTKEEGFWGGDIMWATPTDMTALPSPYLFSTSRRITQAGLDGCSSKLFPVGSILMTSRATIGSFAVNQQPVSVNQGFIVVEPLATHDRWFLFHEMRRRVPEFIQQANGSTFLEISRGTFKSLPITWPDEEVRRDLHEKLDPIHSAAAALQAEIAQLSVTRDELLPLLLSGAVTVSESAA